MIELPTGKSEPRAINPRFMILFGKAKVGKTQLVSGLENHLIIDLENGSDYVSCTSVKINSIAELRELASKIREAGKPYDYGVIDTATKLEDLVGELAITMYQDTPMGKNWGKKAGEDDIRKLPNGGGYFYIRAAFKQIIDVYKGLFNKGLILIGHTSDAMINKDGKELSEQKIDLSGKLGRIISADADALGYVYRKKNQTIINFNGGEDFIVEARSPHLRGKEIVVVESEPIEGSDELKFNYFWNKVFK